ncbi:MAG: LbtU family siderophore porin [Deltaproteobacteria bacterium]|nr:LbtU family siderophore porin [Deltaproteobacteria bacterium]
MSIESWTQKGLLLMGTAALLATVSPVNVRGAENRPGTGEIDKHNWGQVEEGSRTGEEQLVRQNAPAKQREGKDGLLAGIRDYLNFSGLIEIEAFRLDGYAGEKESDLTLSTVELDLHLRPRDWLNGHLLLLWEENNTEPVEVDEAVISLGNPLKNPLFLNIGKLYVPFGLYATNMIQDPLTLALGESRETAVVAGMEYGGFSWSIYAFNGDMDKTGEKRAIDNFGASLDYLLEGDMISLEMGIDYINNLADSDGLSDALASRGSDGIYDYAPGLGTHLQLSRGPFALFAEYIGVLDRFAVRELPYQGKGAKPEAWQLEASYTAQIMERETVFALGYQKTMEAANMGLPSDRYLTSATIALTSHLFLALEYVFDEDYREKEGGSGGEANMITTQLALEF